MARKAIHQEIKMGNRRNAGNYEELRDEVSPELKRKLTLYDWSVLLASFLAVMICTGIIGSMSVFYVEFLKEFKNTKAGVALVPSLANGMYDIGGVLAGMMIDSLGCRKSVIIGAFLSCIPTAISFVTYNIVALIFLLGIICAFGSSIVMLTGMVRVGQQFGHEHPIGTVIISGSHPAGFIIFPQIMPLLIKLYTWRGAVLILSGIILNVIPLGLLATYGMKKEKNVESKEQDEESCKKRCLTKCPLDWDLLRNLKFELFALTSAVNWSSTYLVHLLIVDFAEERGFSLSQGASLLTMVGIAALLSRALAGVLKMIRRVKSVTWYIIFGLIASVIHACLPLNKSYLSLVCTVITIGVIFGCRFSFFVLALLDLVPVKKYSQALGYCLSLWGIGVMITGPIVGEISSVKGSYDFSYITGGMVGVMSLVPLAIYLIRNKEDFSLRTQSTDII